MNKASLHKPAGPIRISVYSPLVTVGINETFSPRDPRASTALAETILTVTAAEAAAVRALPADDHIRADVEVYDQTSERIWVVCHFADLGLVAAVVTANPSAEGVGF